MNRQGNLWDGMISFENLLGMASQCQSLPLGRCCRLIGACGGRNRLPMPSWP